MKKNSARKMHKALLLVVAMTLVLGVAIGGTIAYLVATAGVVTNTFTVGEIAIELQEHVLTDNGTLGTEWTDSNTYHIVPGDTLPKDPTVTVLAKSEACYVYVCVENQLVIDGNTVATPVINTGFWSVVAEQGNKTVYKYNAIVPYETADNQLEPVFSTVTINADITAGELPSLNETDNTNQIIINAYAHQSDNVNENVAQAAALTYFDVTATATEEE